MNKQKYTEVEFKELLTEHNLDWSVRENGVERSFIFANFIEAFQFMGEIAIVAEKFNHHPEWTNVYNKVFIRFTTHDAGGLTQNDLDIILEIESIVNS
ncbi:MAG: 4a-hydroxytetrahydrobiopterin dehydratase [Crocinitomicaceae bacterium]|nr:4a-hydroxytetrahydrobiopterin dehydratase [Crocinitomicaceae bacterium]